MELGWNFFTFPFQGKDWQGRAAVGVGLAFVGYMLVSYVIGILFWLPLLGFGVRVMRQTMQGVPPTLPDWDDWKSLFRDGLRLLAVLFVYLLPLNLFNCAGIGIITALFMGAIPFVEENPALAFSFVAGQFLFFVILGLGFALGVPLALMAITGMTRAVAEDRLGAAFELGQVWALLKRGGGRFVVSSMLFVGLYLVGSVLIQLSVYTVILCFVYPVLFGLLIYYVAVMGGALFGAAYYETEGAPQTRPAAGPAADVAPAVG